jgi:hypothetical protein
MLTYPFAYLRRTRMLVEGPGTRDTRSWAAYPLHKLIHATLLRLPVRRAVFHFISQTMLRLQRNRIYLVLYGGVGLSVVVATILRLKIAHQQVRMEVSADGLRSAIGIVAFWTIAGLHMAFVSPGNRQGNWIFRIAHGRLTHFRSAMQQLQAAKLWVLLWALIIIAGAFVTFRAIAPPELLSLPTTTSQLLMAAGLCLLLTEIFFLNVTAIPFTSEQPREQSNLALSVLKYFAFVPAVALLPIACEPWIEMSAQHFVLAAAMIVAAHLALQSRHRGIVREHCEALTLDDDEEEFPIKLGLRY